jgi:hypothetical protein
MGAHISKITIPAHHLSEHTVKDYVNTFHKFTAFLGDDVPIEDITHKEIEAFFTAQTTVSNKTLLNYRAAEGAGQETGRGFAEQYVDWAFSIELIIVFWCWRAGSAAAGIHCRWTVL